MAGAGALVVVLAALGVWWLLGGGEVGHKSATTSFADTSRSGAATTAIEVGRVEVPELVGKSMQDAEIVLRAAGLSIAVSGDDSTTGSYEGLWVISAKPPAGTILAVGDVVRIILGERLVGEAAVRTLTPATASDSGWLVCIDPGHQAHSSNDPEPIGPGATETKDRVTGGATGVSTKIPEYELNLQISIALKKALEQRGVRVLMVRSTNDVDISNSERAAFANRSGADLFVRIHCDGNTDQKLAGISTQYPKGNSWVRPIEDASYRSALAVQGAVITATGAVDRGTVGRSDLSGFNWCKVPTCLVECGFLSNPVEDKLLASPHYQDKLATGIANGVVRYLEETKR